MALLSSVITNVKVYDESTDSYGEEIYFANSQSDALSGGTLTGDLNTLNVYPAATGTYDLGSSSLRYKYLYVQYINASGNIAASGQLSGATLSISGASTLSGAVTAKSTLTVSGATTLNSTLTVSGATTLNSALTVNGNIKASTLTITNDGTIGTNLSIGNNLTLGNNLYITSHIFKQSAPYSDIDFDSSSTLAIGIRTSNNTTSSWGSYIQFGKGVSQNYTYAIDIKSDNLYIDSDATICIAGQNAILQIYSTGSSLIQGGGPFIISSMTGDLTLQTTDTDNETDRYDITLDSSDSIFLHTNGCFCRIYRDIDDGIILSSGRARIDMSSANSTTSSYFKITSGDYYLKLNDDQGFELKCADGFCFYTNDKDQSVHMNNFEDLTIACSGVIHLDPADTYDSEGNLDTQGSIFARRIAPEKAYTYNLGEDNLSWNKVFCQAMNSTAIDSNDDNIYNWRITSTGTAYFSNIYIGSQSLKAYIQSVV